MKPAVTCSGCGSTLGIHIENSSHCATCKQSPQTEPFNNKLQGLSKSQEQTMLVPGGSGPKTNLVSPTLPRATFKNLVGKKVGEFEILSLLGKGGMGTVYLAYEPLLNRRVALKVLSYGADQKKHVAESARFLSEASLTGRLAHSGIIPIYRVNFDPDAGLYFYTMRYIRGQTLAGILNDQKAGLVSFSLAKTLALLLRVCEAVAFAHRHHVIHRDLKPANIMVTKFGEVFVLDWGLAKDIRPAEKRILKEVAGTSKESKCRRRNTSSTRFFLAKGKESKNPNSKRLQAIQEMTQELPKNLTAAGDIMGTPAYLSPEQGLASENIGPASDVYTLGVILYEILTHRPTVDTQDPIEIIKKTIMGKIVPIEERPEACRVPRALCDIVTRALTRTPADRYPDAGALEHDLSLYLEGRAALKPICEGLSDATPDEQDWKSISGTPKINGGSLVLESPDRIRCERFSMGDFRCRIGLQVEPQCPNWAFSVRIWEVQGREAVEPRYKIRMGVSERAFVELVRHGERVLRRFDLRLQAGQAYDLSLEMEEGRMRLRIGERTLLEYKEFFPQNGGAVELGSERGTLKINSFNLSSRGAPLNLSFMFLPDRLYRRGKFAEAREFYRQLADSHPDREEGMLSLYKAGLCSTELEDTQTAFEEFARLEGTMFDHLCALGLARIGAMDKNIDWAWEALKNGYKKHLSSGIRSEVWFALLGLIHTLDENQAKEKVRRYWELLHDLDPEPEEAAQLTFDLLDTCARSGNISGLRKEAATMLKRYAHMAPVATEALLALWHVGIDENAIPHLRQALKSVMSQNPTKVIKARLLILSAELNMAEHRLIEAAEDLRNATHYAGRATPDGLWAQGWTVLVHLLKESYQEALTRIHEMQVTFKHTQRSQITYILLLEAVAYFGRKFDARAFRLLEGISESNGVWGQTAAHILVGDQPEELLSSLSCSSPNQVVEALFLAGEALYLNGIFELSKQHFFCAREHPCARVMIKRFAQKRINHIEDIKPQ